MAVLWGKGAIIREVNYSFIMKEGIAWWLLWKGWLNYEGRGALMRKEGLLDHEGKGLVKYDGRDGRKWEGMADDNEGRNDSIM